MNTVINGLEVDPSLEGESHVNIYSNSNCNLGRLLSNFTYMPSDTPYGRFDSMEGYYHWLKLTLSIGAAEQKPLGWVEKLDKLRYIYGVKALRVGRALRQELINEGVRIIDLPTDEFTRLFKYGLLTKILSNKELLSEIKDNRLPIVHYYIMDGKIIYKPRFDWLANLVTDIYVELLGY